MHYLSFAEVFSPAYVQANKSGKRGSMVCTGTARVLDQTRFLLRLTLAIVEGRLKLTLYA